MKRIVISIGVFILLSLFVSAWAASVDGKWIAEVASSQGQQNDVITLVFKTHGSKLTGTINNSQMPGDVAINEGKIEGGKVSFSINRTIGQNVMQVVWKGTVIGNTIKFTRDIKGGMGGPMGGSGSTPEIIAKRAK